MLYPFELRALGGLEPFYFMDSSARAKNEAQALNRYGRFLVVVVVAVMVVTVMIAVPVVVAVPVVIGTPLATIRVVPAMDFVIAAVPGHIQFGFGIFGLAAAPAVLANFLAIVLLGLFSAVLAA